MAKKGIIQLQDVTFVLVIILMFMVSYLFFHKSNSIGHPVSYSAKMDIDPPLSTNPVFFPPDNPPQNGRPMIKAIPINVETRKMNTTNTQLGFLRLEHEESNKTRNALKIHFFAHITLLCTNFLRIVGKQKTDVFPHRSE
jgi:hypothetical protein